MIRKYFLFIITLSLQSCLAQPLQIKPYESVTTGAQRMDAYLPLLKGKRVGVLTNQTGMVGNRSLVDTLITRGVNVTMIFSPEHGFRGQADAGVKVAGDKDQATGLPVISLYGKSKKPAAEQLKNVDILVYDIQDVGVRFYTYISTMTYAMDACAENGKHMMVLDRPNPNGFYVDGPVLESQQKSFLGLHPVPVVYGMTCGEYARMVNSERWLASKDTCRLTVISLENYDRNSSYLLPVKPSPNLPNERAILLYPSLGLFEGTMMSLGRGTEFPFQVIGHPGYPDTTFCFKPVPNDVSKSPKYVNARCCGISFRDDEYLINHPRKINISWLTGAYAAMKSPVFFEATFNAHSGNQTLQEQIKKSVPEEKIRDEWRERLEKFKVLRKKYLLYPDFRER